MSELEIELRVTEHDDGRTTVEWWEGIQHVVYELPADKSVDDLMDMLRGMPNVANLTIEKAGLA